MNQPATPANVPLKKNFNQVCLWEGVSVTPHSTAQEFEAWMAEEFDGTRVQYLEEVKTNAGEGGPGGRNDLLFAVHTDDIAKFAVPRIAYHIRWLDDVYGNGHAGLYEPRIAAYLCWDPEAPDGPTYVQDCAPNCGCGH